VFIHVISSQHEKAALQIVQILSCIEASCKTCFTGTRLTFTIANEPDMYINYNWLISTHHTLFMNYVWTSCANQSCVFLSCNNG